MVDGSVAQITLSEASVDRALRLVEAPESYFDLTNPWIAVPLSRLRQTRVRAAGVERAIGYMEEAAQGRIPVRDTITVQVIDDALFAVVDGNSTVTVARIAGWTDLPCHLADIPAAPNNDA